MSAIWTTLLGLGDKLAAHVLLSAAAIALGIAVALPLRCTLVIPIALPRELAAIPKAWCATEPSK